MKRVLVTTVASLWSAFAAASPTSRPVRAEIDALLAKLQASGCQFNRNGSWYSGSEARDHLLRKLEYLEGKGSILSTEQFIELGASKSSSSGQAYSVKCGGQSPVSSQAWLTQQLPAIRATTGKAAKP
jgi:hypothetical protein